MLTRAMTNELSAASAHECFFVDFLSKEDPKKVFGVLKHPGWVDAMQDELNQFARNKLEAIRIFLAFATYINFIVYQIDVKSAFLNGKLKEEVYVKQHPGFESNEFPNHIKQSGRGISINQEKYVKGLLKKYDINGSSVKTLMVSPNNLGHDLSGKAINETQYRGMIGSLMYLKSTPSLGMWYPKCSSFDLKGYLDPDYAGCNMDRKSTSSAYVGRCCANILWMKSQLTNYDIIYEKVPIFYDNTSAIAISNNPVQHSRTKHIDIRDHFIRDHVLKGEIELHFIPTQYQLVPLDEPTFKRLIVELGMLNIDSKPEASVLPEET
ncbi:retrovirus-related pol polyprotein from transposon TNT 1-94 [Tanacetum coccineum]